MKNYLLFVLLIAPALLFSQEDSDLMYSGTRIQGESEVDSTGKLFLSGYVDTYYALYSDKTVAGNFVKFPTAAPRNNQVGLNLLQLQARYGSEKVRGVASLFYGDIASSSWSTDYNMIQEANLGFRIKKGLWLDVGFFRTHIGLESIQPRENIASSAAIPSYFEPYYLSGAKLTYELTEKLRFQFSLLNGYNTFVDRNRSKAFGLSGVYDFSARTSLVVNTLLCDESPDSLGYNQYRVFNNIYLTHKVNRLNIGAEFNFGFQQNSRLINSNATAGMWSGIISAKYRLTKKTAVYGRGEAYQDSDEILTGPVENQYHELVGINLIGATLGVEFNLIKNSYLRIESRVLQTTGAEAIFVLNGQPSNRRYEGIASFGVWF